MGLSVPDVMITLWNLVNTGFIAKLASRQLNCKTDGHEVPTIWPGKNILC